VLSFDLNSLLHAAAQRCYSYGNHKTEEREAYLLTKPGVKVLEKEYLVILGMELESIITAINPLVCVILAIDGVAPMAKITQQRPRRYRSALSGGASPYFDSNAITPGTKFMFGVEKYLKEWIQSHSTILPPRTIFSGWRTPGEGESKMFPLFDHSTPDDEFDCKNLIFLIYGMDADIIILSMFHTKYQNIFMVREDPRDTISIKHLREGLAEDMLGRKARDIHEIDQCMKDFTLLSFMLGNDFIPATPMLRDIDTGVPMLIGNYRKTGLSLTIKVTDSGFLDINWENFLVFLKTLQSEEKESLTKITKMKYEYPSQIYEHSNKSGVFNVDDFRSMWYGQNFALNGTQKSQTLLSNLCILAGSDISEMFGLNTSQVEKQCQHYLITFLWNLNYYLGNMKFNIGWFYGYHYAPMLVDVISVIEFQVVGNMDTQLSFVENAVRPTHHFLHPFQQMLCVLPPQSKKLLPVSIKSLMDSEACVSSPILDLFPTSAMIERSGTSREWMGTLLIPHFNPGRIIEETSLLVDSKNKEYVQEAHLAFDKDIGQAKKDKDIVDYYTVLKSKLIAKTRLEKTGEINIGLNDPQEKTNFGGRGRGDSGGRGRGRGDSGGRGRGRGDSGGRGRGRGDSGGRGRGRGDSSGRGRGRGDFLKNPSVPPLSRHVVITNSSQDEKIASLVASMDL
jgi:5'-3' exonuclease